MLKLCMKYVLSENGIRHTRALVSVETKGVN